MLTIYLQRKLHLIEKNTSITLVATTCIKQSKKIKFPFFMSRKKKHYFKGCHIKKYLHRTTTIKYIKCRQLAHISVLDNTISAFGITGITVKSVIKQLEYRLPAKDM